MKRIGFLSLICQLDRSPEYRWHFLLSIGVIRQMILIRDIVQKALSTGYLTLEAEEQLRQMLLKKYELEDLNAFMSLQEAAMAGRVKQQSREPMGS